MSIILKHILRNIRENKFRSVLIILSLTISTAVMFLNVTVKDDILTKYNAVLRGAYKEVDVMVSKGDGDKDRYFSEKDVNLSGVTYDDMIETTASFGIYNYENEKYTINFVGADNQKLEKAQLCELEQKSSQFQYNAKDQVVISKKTAEHFKIKLDDTIKILTKQGEYPFKVTGIAKNNGFYIDEGENNYIMFVINKDLSGKFAENQGKISGMYLNLPKDANNNTTVDQINKNNPSFKSKALIDEEGIADALTSITQMLTMILCIAIGLNFYVISSITKLILSVRTPVIGTFRSIGATKKQMNTILVMENVIYGIIGGVIGIIIGIFSRDSLSGMFISGDALNNVDIQLSMKPLYIILAMGFSILLQLLVSIKFILRANKKSIKDSIFNTLSTSYKMNRKKVIVGIVFIPVAFLINSMNAKYNFYLSVISLLLLLTGGVFVIPGFTKYIAKVLTAFNRKAFGEAAALGTKNLSNNKSVIASIILVSVTLSFMIMIFVMSSSLNTMFNGLSDTYTYDEVVTGMDKESKEYDYLKNLKEVKSIDIQYYYYVNDGKINGNKKNLLLMGSENEVVGVQSEEVKIKDLKENEVLLDQYYANKNNYKIGDTLTIEEDGFIQKSVNLKIVGFCNSMEYSSMRNVMVMRLIDYKNAISVIPSEMNVYGNPGVDQDKLKDILVDQFAGTNINVQTMKDFVKVQKDSVSSIINMVIVIIILSGVLAAFGLVNNQLIGFIQRKKEFAVLYSTSMSKSQLRKMILFEGLGTFTVGCLLGSGIGFGMIVLLKGLLYSMDICFKFSYDIPAIIMIMGAVFVALTITTISPIHKISKIKVVEELKYE